MSKPSTCSVAFRIRGKDETRPAGERLSEAVVLRLVEPYMGKCKCRNVTMYNFFTSISLPDKLIAKKTSLLGTVNKQLLPSALNNILYQWRNSKQECLHPQHHASHWI
jgi:hypothetical protein